MATARKPRASTVKETTFAWEGKNKDGKVVRGEIRAASVAVVQTTLRRQGISNPSVKKVGFKMGKSYRKRHSPIHPPISYDDEIGRSIAAIIRYCWTRPR